MIVAGTVTSAPVGSAAVTTTGPVDENPPNGFTVVGNNGKWLASPSGSAAYVNLGTLSAVAGTVILDWTLGGYYWVTTGATSVTFTFTNAAGVFTPSVGQILRLRLVGGGATVTWPAGTFNILGAGAAVVTTFVAPGSAVTYYEFICTNNGSSPTFDVITITS